MASIMLPRGSTAVRVDIADSELGEVLSPLAADAALDPAEETRKALRRPLGAVPLRQLAGQAGQPGSVAVIIDDITRKTPTREMLPPLLEELAAAGVDPGAVSIVIALGTHRPMTREEIDQKVGPAVAARCRIVNVPASDEDSLEYLGESSNGVPAWVNRTVARADLRIGLGQILPHLDAGFGGGAKIVMPGVCGQRTVEAFHKQMAFLDESQLARHDAPLRLDLEAFVAERAPLHFIVNAVLDVNSAVAHCVGGHPVQAHRAGARLSMDVYGAAAVRRYPVVLANAYPCDMDFWQATKALAAAERLAEPGGSIILAADCPDAYGGHDLFAEYIARSIDELRGMITTGQAEDVVAAAEAVAMRRLCERFRVAFVGGGIAQHAVRGMGLHHYPDIQGALAGELAGRAQRLAAVLTQAGVQAPTIQP